MKIMAIFFLIIINILWIFALAASQERGKGKEKDDFGLF